jgi:hypothetical protein
MEKGCDVTIFAGVWEFSNGDQYEGEIVDGRLHGRGLYHFLCNFTTSVMYTPYHPFKIYADGAQNNWGERLAFFSASTMQPQTHIRTE